MKLPRIYSLSTVGVLKHLHQDYLLHPLRTDFTGSNGIGKSIIADLMQLIFITDRNLVKFGTDSLNPDQRKIEKLPYRSNEAYAFLNIEMFEDHFVTIGVCISSKRGIPLKPFVILAKPDLRLPITELAYHKSKLLTSADFLGVGKAVLSNQDVAKSIKQNNSLSIIYFQFKEQLLEYYSFLFNKEILPINLAKEENLKAFAKIIQSFSKAKGLDLKNSNALKSFLFEDSEKEYETKFKEYERDFDKLLSDFQSLERDIADIESKQTRLRELKGQETARYMARLANQKAELHQAQLSCKELKDGVDELEKKIKKDKEHVDKLESRSKSLKKQIEEAEKTYEVIDINLMALLKYVAQSSAYRQLEKDFRRLKSMTLPELNMASLKEGSQIQIDEWEIDRIIATIAAQLPLFQDYGQLADIETKYEAQHHELERRKKEANDSIEHLLSWLNALSQETENSLLNAVLNQGKVLSVEQESVLRHFVGLQLVRPKEPSKGDRFTVGTNILEQQYIEIDLAADGMWLKLGELREFVPKFHGNPLFNRPEKWQDAIAKKRDELQKEIDQSRLVVTQLAQADRGKDFDREILENFNFDLRLAEYSAINRVKEVIGLVKSMNEKTESLLKQQKAEKDKLDLLTAPLTITIEENTTKQIEELEAQKLAADKVQKKITEEWNREKEKLSTLQGTIERQSDSHSTKQSQLDEANRLLDGLQNAFIQAFPEEKVIHETEPKLTHEEHAALREVKQKSEITYAATYKSINDAFEETKGGHERITPQIKEGTYSFSELESVLLGRIGHLDEIAPYLIEANAHREGMMESIQGNMIKLFSLTREKYDNFERVIHKLNTFFKGQKISEEYFVHINFDSHPHLDITILDKILEQGRWNYKPGELALGHSVKDFVENFFLQHSALREKVRLLDLLNPKSYFDLTVKLEDENNNEIPGSTGETYSAITLLGIARLSQVQTKDRKGIKFIILEESANLDKTNFNTFPKIAKDHGYQILTMTPRPYGTDSEDGWYMHQLIKGKKDKMRNYPRPASYFRDKNSRQDLETYLNAVNK